MTTNRKPHPTTDTLKNFIFEGIDGEECEDLIHAVRFQAREVDRLTDNDYMARWASACMVGNALRWYIALPQEIKYDWEKLEQALATEFPINYEARLRGHRTRPGDVRRGRLRVISNDPSRDGYVSSGPNASKLFVRKAAISEALQVEWTTPLDDGFSQLRLLNQIAIGGKPYDLLGASFHESNPLGLGLPTYGSLTPATMSVTGAFEYAENKPGGQKIDIWHVDSDGSISIQWDDGIQVQELIALSDKSYNVVWVICQSDLAAFNMKHRPNDPSFPVRLFIEPFV